MNKLAYVALAGLAGTAFAAAAPMAAPMNHWYAGVGVNHYSGWTESNDSYGYDINHNLVKTDSFNLSKTKLGYNFFVGNHVTRHFGTELGLNFIGNRTYKAKSYAVNDHGYIILRDHPVTTQYKYYNTWNAYYDGIFTFPVMNGFSVYGKAGVNYFKTHYKTVSPISEDVTSNGSSTPDHYTTERRELGTWGWNYGGGIQYTYNQFGVRGDYTHLNFTHSQELGFNTPNLVSFDLFYQFA